MKKQTQQLPIVLARDEAAIALHRGTLETLLISVQNMVAVYQKFPFAAPGAQPMHIYNAAETEAQAYVKKNLPETMTVAGLSLNKARFAQFVEIEGFASYREARDQVNAQNGAPLLSYFEVEPGQQAFINEARFQQFIDSHSVMAVTESDKLLYDKWLKMISGLVEFNNLVKFNFTFMAGLSAPKLGVFLKEDKQGKIVPSPTLFQAISKQLNKKHEDMQ